MFSVVRLIYVNSRPPGTLVSRLAEPNDQSSFHRRSLIKEGVMRQVRLSLTFAGLVLSTALGFLGVTVTSESARAVVYCQYVDYPVGCVARAGVVLRPRPVARAAAREAVRPGTPMNRGGPVNRVGRR